MINRLNSPLVLALATGLYVTVHYSIANFTMLNLPSVLTLAFVFTAPILLLVWLIGHGCKDRAGLRGALSIAACMIWFLMLMHYPILDLPWARSLFDAYPPTGFYLAVSVPLLAMIVFLSWLFRHTPVVGTIALSVMALTVLLMYSNLVIGNITAVLTSEHAEPLEISLAKKPNIYLFLSDGLASMAYLEDEGYSIEPLQHLLQSNHFQVSREAFSNYQPTLGAMISMLNMEHHYNELVHNQHEAAWLGRHIIAGKNRFVSTLRDQGYLINYVHMGTYLLLRGCWADLCFPEVSQTVMAQNLLRRLLPRYRVINEYRSPERQAKNFAVWKQQTERAQASGQALFQYTHIYGPGHSPGAVRDRCDMAEEKANYQHRVSLATARLDRMISTVIATDPEAVIVLAGDHGPFLTHQCSWYAPLNSVGEYRDRAGAMMAVRWPAGISPPEQQALSTTVNLLRQVLANLSNDPQAVMEDRAAEDVYIRINSRDVLAVKDGIIQLPPQELE